MTTPERRLIETDAFPVEFLSAVAERESWRKEIHRPVFHVHKWWAKRLGSIFRGVLLGCALEPEDDLKVAFYERHALDKRVLDPFMGSGTTIGEAHKLGMTALGRDINPVAVRAVRTALGPMDANKLDDAMRRLSASVGEEIRRLYSSEDDVGRKCEVLYFFWVMQAACTACDAPVDLFSSRVMARNAYPDRKPRTHVVCPGCGAIFEGVHGCTATACPTCDLKFDPEVGAAKGAKATCSACETEFRILDAMRAHNGPPSFRLYGKMVLREDGTKAYARASVEDRLRYDEVVLRLREAERSQTIALPDLPLTEGHNTKQAMSYGFNNWRDFFNARQLLALALLRRGILELTDPNSRDALLTLFSGALEFNNMFASYKGEGTGAVRHMFSHHILKPERVPIEANVWGTRKSSGSFSGLFRGRIARVLQYRAEPTEVALDGDRKSISALPFGGIVSAWPQRGKFQPRGIHLSCGDSSKSSLPDESVDYVVTDPPFFDNVHYSELADFFHAWQQLDDGPGRESTRHAGEVQDADPHQFSRKLSSVFSECYRVLKPGGLLVFSYHHSREDGWESVAEAIFDSGFGVVNSHPVKAEMSVAMPKTQAKSPIQLDVLIVCRKTITARPSAALALAAAESKARRLESSGLVLSANDLRVTYLGQLLTAAASTAEFVALRAQVERALENRVPEQARAAVTAPRGTTLSLFPH